MLDSVLPRVSNPPDGTLRPALCSEGPRNSVDPASTAKAPLMLLWPSRYAFSAGSSWEVAAPVATSWMVKPLPCSTEAAPS